MLKFWLEIILEVFEESLIVDNHLEVFIESILTFQEILRAVLFKFDFMQGNI